MALDYGASQTRLDVTSASAYLTAISPTVMQMTLPEDYKPDLAKKYLANKLNAKEANNGVSDIREGSERSLNLLLAITGLVSTDRLCQSGESAAGARHRTRT